MTYMVLLGDGPGAGPGLGAGPGFRIMILETCTKVTFPTGTSATEASLLLMDEACALKSGTSMLNRVKTVTSRLYEHLKPATHLQWTGRLDWAGLRVLVGQAVWERPAQ